MAVILGAALLAAFYLAAIAVGEGVKSPQNNARWRRTPLYELRFHEPRRAR